MPELLAPAGGMDALRAAVQNGADAVYIGGRAFNARAFADNFDLGEIVRAADYCHLRGSLLYITLNTMMLQEDLEQGAEEARQYFLAGADALIVADMGLAKAIRETCPKIPLYASTQLCIHNVQGVRLAEQMEFKRAVLARELSLTDIREITQKGGLETEVFVHGALCSSVSGLCLLSSFIGERSGNRGRCAQPCRLDYEIDGKKAYHLSMADLCAANLMPELIQSGVSSFKIEGRMKNSQYVGGVVRAYRQIIDAALEGKAPPRDSIAGLNDYYNRTFTSGYLQGNTYVTAPDKPGNRNIDKERIEIRDEKEKTFYRIDAQVRLAQGQKPSLTLQCGEYKAQVTGEEELPQANKPLQQETVAHAIGKTGGTPFDVRETEVMTEGEPFISVSGLNNLRKAGIEALEQEMLRGWHTRECKQAEPLTEEECPHSLREVYVQTGDADAAVQYLRAGAGRVYFAPDVFTEKMLARAKTIEQETGVKPYIVFPTFLRQKDMEYIDKVLAETHGLFGGALAGNFGQIELLKSYFKNIIADYTCNIANRKTVRQYADMGFTGVTLSAELNKKDMNAIKGCTETEIIAYGYLPLMWLAHPLPNGEMRDRRGYTYRIRRIRAAAELTAIQNPVLLAMREIASIRHSVDAIRLLADGYEDETIEEYIRAVREGRDAEIIRKDASQGHLKRGV
jgi:U32 family peptidase